MKTEWIGMGSLRPEQRNETGNWSCTYNGEPLLTSHGNIQVKGGTIQEILKRVNEHEFSNMEFTRVGYKEYRAKYLVE